jgi:hypothetical protein
MKSKCFALAALLVVFTGTVAAQDFSFGWNPRSGDAWVDSQLDDVNRYGSRYREPFVDEMVRYYGAPRDLVTELLVTRRWAPGDIYYACAIAQTLGRPCRYVVDEWDRNHGKGWGAVAKELGIKPGSAEFHRLKRGFVPTYDRWARPIDIDADLRKDFPNRGKGQKGGNGAPGKAKVHAAPVPAKANGADLGKSHGGADAASGKSQGSSGAKDKAPDKGKGKGGKGNGNG